MFGPVFQMEWTLGTRRGRLNGIRRLYTAWLAGQFIFLFVSVVVSHYVRNPHIWPLKERFQRFTDVYIETLVLQQALVLFLATPAFVAGAITDEKSRGTLPFLFTTGLSSWDIVVGKLLARLAQVGVIGLAALPMFCFLAGARQFDPLLLLAVAGVTVAPLFAVGAVSMLASVWTRQTRDAVLISCGVCALAVAGLVLLPEFVLYLAVRFPGLGLPQTLGHDVLAAVEPGFVIRSWHEPGELGRRLLVFTAAWGGLGLVSVSLAVWRLRPTYLRQLENHARSRPGLPGGWAAGRPAVSDDPVRWKEIHIEGLAPLDALRRVPRWCGLLGVALATVLLDASFPDSVAFARQAVVSLLVAMLVVGVRSSGTITRERERQTWDGLMLTDLEARDIVRGKFRGVLRACVAYWLAYALPALLVAGWRYQDAFLWTLGGVLVTLPIAYFVAAAGVWCSARSTSSWRSLLGTLALAYLGGSVFLCTALPFTLLAAAWISMVLNATGARVGILLVPALAVCQWIPYWIWAQNLLSSAELRLGRVGADPDLLRSR